MPFKGTSAVGVW